MKILSIGNFGFGWDGSICDEEHIAEALEELGHNVIRLQREEFGKVGGIPWANDYDFCLIAQWDGYKDSWLEELKKIKQYGRDYPIVYWAFDYQADGQEWHERLIKQADLYLSKRIADSKYANWQWLSQDFAPAFLDKFTHYENAEPIDVLFTGSYLPWATERNETLKAVDEKFNLVIHSINEWPGFKDQRGPVMDHALPELYARARVILSIDHTLEAGYWSDRNAQIMACGKRPLFRYIPLSEVRFGNRVDYFYNTEDCLQKIKEFSAAPTNAEGLYVKDRVQDLLTIVEGILCVA
jgi:hypothetical protein